MEFDKLIRKRASIRKYSSQKVDVLKVIDAIESANLSPSPGNLPILRYIIIEDKNKIQEIAKACMQDFIADAPLIVVACSNSKRAEILYKERARKYITQHSGAAIENFLLKITDLGLASCWIGAFSDIILKRILKIPDSIEIEAVLPVAYQSKADSTKQKPKSSLDGKIFFNVWGNRAQVPVKKIRRDDV